MLADVSAISADAEAESRRKSSASLAMRMVQLSLSFMRFRIQARMLRPVAPPMRRSMATLFCMSWIISYFSLVRRLTDQPTVVSKSKYAQVKNALYLARMKVVCH